MKDLDLTTLRLFLAVYDARSIARVAEREHMVASAINKRLSRLEADLGVVLLQRTGRGMAPTAAGHLMAQRCRDIVSSAQDLVGEFEDFDGGVRGSVTVMGSYAMMAGRLIDDVREFLSYPDHERVRVQLQQHDRAGVAQSIRDGHTSLGVLWNLADTSGLLTYPYRTDHIAAVMHCSHPLAGRAALSYDEAAEFETVRIPATRATEAMLKRSGGIAQAARRNRVEVPSFEAALRMVAGGRYVSFVPAEIARLHAMVLDLQVIPLTDPWAVRRHVIACRQEVPLAPAAQALLKHLIASAQATPAGNDPFTGGGSDSAQAIA